MVYKEDNGRFCNCKALLVLRGDQQVARDLETDLFAQFSEQKGSTLAIAAVNATEWLQDDKKRHGTSIPV
jgi:hypothetical protein